MERTTFNYSTKNIPLSRQRAYKRKLIEKTAHFMKRVRWRAFFYLNPEKKPALKETYGFKTRKTPTTANELKTFEDGMLQIIQNIEFHRNVNHFQRQMKRDIENIDNNKLLVKADKTNNFYQMTPDDYMKLLKSNITQTYKKSNWKTVNEINSEAKTLANHLNLDDRIESTAEKDCYITLKDHKPNFNNRPTCRLINPTKSEIGRISKIILEKIVAETIGKTNSQLWRNTTQVVNWFKDLPKSPNTSFMCFDIVSFYPSISEKLLMEAINFAKEHTSITDQQIEIIFHAKKTILFNDGEPWRKKGNDDLFDVTMGSYDGAECCELVAAYLLSLLDKKYGRIFGLYRDDGLGTLHCSPREAEQMKKQICKLFNNKGLSITIEANKRTINYLDITLDLKHNTHCPYKKPNETTMYVNVNSNHPPTILQNIPKGVNKRLSSLSSNDDLFKKTTLCYQKAINDAGYHHVLNFHGQTNNNNNKPRQRNRKVIWYNPPFDLSVKTNIGHKFLKLINDSFPCDNPLSKIFNRNTIKLSYSCMPSIKKIIDGNNKKILKNQQQQTEINQKSCNCRKPMECPLDGNCLKKNIIYQATVESNLGKETYVGLCETDFKTRYTNHKSSIKNQKKTTKLSKYTTELSNMNIKYSVKYRMLAEAKPYNKITKRCNLCIEEIYYIIYHPELATLNKRTELINTCRHASKFLIANYKPIT